MASRLPLGPVGSSDPGPWWASGWPAAEGSLSGSPRHRAGRLGPGQEVTCLLVCAGDKGFLS